MVLPSLMLKSRAIPLTRWFAAIVCSVILHATFAGGWFFASPMISDFSGDDLSFAQSPADDRETTIVLKDLPTKRFQIELPKVSLKIPEPAKLPPDLKPSNPATAKGGNTPSTNTAEQQASYLPENNGGSTKKSPVGIPNLHGKIKEGKCVVYLIDCSSSMNLDLPRARSVVQSSIRQLTEKSKFQIVAYNGSARACFSAPVAATDDRIRFAERWLENLSSEGRSDHVCGFREAMSHQPDAVFLLTDADDFEEKEVKKIMAFTPAAVFVNAAIFCASESVPMVSPLDYLTRRHGGSIRQFPR